jgi:hypothetical protein
MYLIWAGFGLSLIFGLIIYVSYKQGYEDGEKNAKKEASRLKSV